jgi:transcriptional regulator GlxA family with amidase domain
MDPAAQDARVKRAIELVKQNPITKVTALAGAVGLSVSRLEHLFKFHTRRRLRDALLDCRLALAAHLLRSTNLEVKEIADLLGYRHPSGFSRPFTLRIGSNPSSYRIRANEQQKMAAE